MSFICIVCRDLLTNRPEGHQGNGPVEIITTKCGHLYHLFCLMEWFRRKVEGPEPKGQHECPYCFATVTTADIQKIFPSEDEETEEIAAKFNEAKANSYEKEIQHLRERLVEANSKLDEEQRSHENLKIDYALKLSEIDQVKRDNEIDLSLLQDSTQSNWKEILDKARKDKHKLRKTINTLEKTYSTQTADLMREHKKTLEELQKTSSDLKQQNEGLKRKLERVSAQQQHNNSSGAGSSSSGSSSGSNFSTHPSTTRLLTSSNQFLNPPNPNRNPYQNLLLSSTGQRTNPAVHANQLPSSQLSQSSSSSGSSNLSTSQSSSSQPSSYNNSVLNSSGGSSSQPSSFSFGHHHHHHPHHHSHGHLRSTLGPWNYYTRNPPYPPAPYSFSTSGSSNNNSNNNNSTGGNSSSGEVQAAHTQPQTSSRTLRMMMPTPHQTPTVQFFMHSNSSSLQDSIPFPSLTSTFQASLHSAPLSPRH